MAWFKTGPYHSLGNEKPSPKATVTGYNNFYEFGTAKEDPAVNAPKWKVPTDWTIRIEGEVMQPKTLSLDQVMKLAPAGRAHLPASVRRALVDRGAMDRLFPEYVAQASSAHRQSQVRGIRDLLRSQGDAVAARSGDSLPLRRRPAPG